MLFYYRPWVILGDIIGGLIMYDYQTKKTMITTNANKNQEHQITCVKYSPNGTYLYLFTMCIYRKSSYRYS